MPYLYCSGCGERTKKRADRRSEEDWGADRARIVVGAVTAPQCRCDGCNQPLPRGDQAAAWTTWTGHQAPPAWEHDYIHQPLQTLIYPSDSEDDAPEVD